MIHEGKELAQEGLYKMKTVLSFEAEWLVEKRSTLEGDRYSSDLTCGTY